MTDLTTSPPTETDTQRITMFGAEWCGDCRRSKKLLDTLKVDYDYVDLLLVEDGADRAHAISGRTQIPVILFPDGSHVVEPSDSTLHSKLTQLGSIL
ncbi:MULTISPECIES: glutaredoxin domain-containing protein [Cryobacterium]|uniref:NrdH-redoxin n=1 Tax=Cryobacterium breve TaxID=1259258 RepID=A0ABY2IVT8_9MICO|nr:MULTISPECIES: glutaredoxin domain-containing protein [Cryobacterium]TFC93627.1 NrdH-redoxin [Cryobacterium sp. TmT3-12]TFC95319.1 NrdH-redoxin [Cryobacterium breve]